MFIGFIGAGKMARALAAGLVRGAVASPENLLCTSRSPESGRAFLDLFPAPGARWTSDLNEVVRRSDLIVLAIKPQHFPDVLPGLREASRDKLFLSLAAGLTLDKIRGWLDPTARVARAMPNTPVQIGAGASVFAGGPDVGETGSALIERVLSASGRAWQVEESQIDAVTALSGSGPAYVFHFIDALLRGGIALGLPEELARGLALQTVLGSAQLAAESPLAPLDLAAQVKSPRGTTLAGCAVLEENGALNALIARCLAAAKDRAEALARGEA
jgi:pyrroline-5-carboxylate reductase